MSIEQPCSNFFNDPDIPAWFKLLQVDEKHFERSLYADPHGTSEAGKFRLKDLGIMREIAPHVYAAAAEQVKEHNEMVAAHGSKIKKYKLGKKIGSIPLYDVTLHPELAHDKAAQKKYFDEHPELRCK